jgi:hypothetical protein
MKITDWWVVPALVSLAIMGWGMGWPTADKGFWGSIIRVGMFLAAVLATLLVWAVNGVVRC